MQIYGPITLSPEVRFTVFAEESAYWRVGVYDRFTGQSWIRTGDAQPYKGRLGLPPGKSNLVSQHYTMEGAMSVMPAAATPIEVSGPAASKAFVDDHGAFQASRTLKKGETYSIKSAVYDGGLDNLAEADGEDPRSIRTTYTQVPSGISSEFRTRTERVVAPADNRLEAALMVESYLERTKSYSLNTTLPSGNVADAFLLRMREGYCVYFATTMTMMLRSQGIPARYVVGYTPGQQVGDNTWVVRGLNSHAWVEVYFPDVGWVKFDPTPGGPRESAEFSRIEAAREAGNENVDTDRSINAPLTPTPTPTPGEPLDDPNRTAPTPEERFRAIPGYGINGTLNGTFTTVGAGGGGGPSLPSPEDAAFAMVLLLGLAAGAHRYGVTDRVVRTVRLRWQPRRGPDEDAERAFDRLEMLLTQDIRPRRTGETPQEYASTMDTVTKLGSRATRVADIYQKAHYGDGVTRSEADEAIELVDELVHERAPRLGTGLLRS
jgi:transglutaminase-like putative cysteine protease